MTEEMDGLEPVIGLEVHAQILTRSKMFCGCRADYAGAAPNSHVCAICAGMPGALPAINRAAVEATILTALALNCRVDEQSKFDRKNYPYPDLPKGYQITQYDMPVGQVGSVEFEADGSWARCGIVRVHLEEDTGKTIHTSADGRELSLVDYNRSGVPLMEIVGEPDLRSPAAAREYFASLRRILMYLGVNDGNLQEGSMRADVNVSLRLPGGDFGTKVEIKNLNSFRAVQRALEYEIERQRSVIAEGKTLQQETRGWSETEERTLSQRSKEYAHDYRYFPEPDLPPLVLSPTMVDEIRSRLPELPSARRRRFIEELGLTPATARVLIEERALADFFEATVAAGNAAPASVANWVTGEVLRLAGETRKLAPEPGRLARLIALVQEGTVSASAGKTILEAMLATEEDSADVARRLDLLQVSDEIQLRAWVDQVVAENGVLVESYRRGKTNVIQALVGKVRGLSGGRADLGKVRALLEAALAT